VVKHSSAILCWIVMGLIIGGCASVISVRPDEPLNNDRVYNFEQVNARLVGLSADIISRGGTRYEADSVHVGKDSASFIDRSIGARHQIAVQDISMITHKDHGAGTFTGGVVGMLAGIGTGIAVMLMTPNDSDSRMGAAVLFLGSTAAGAVLGAVVGSFEGSTIEYHFKWNELPPHTFPDSTKTVDLRR
jgi:hypothetical protein